MQATASLVQIKDIMPSIEIPTGILPYILLATVMLLFLLFVLYHYYKKTKPHPTPQSAALHHLQQMDFTKISDASLLYQFSLDTQCYLDGREDQAFDEIQYALIPYKYHVDAPPLDMVLRQRIHDYIKGLT